MKTKIQRTGSMAATRLFLIVWVAGGIAWEIYGLITHKVALISNTLWDAFSNLYIFGLFIFIVAHFVFSSKTGKTEAQQKAMDEAAREAKDNN